MPQRTGTIPEAEGADEQATAREMLREDTKSPPEVADVKDRFEESAADLPRASPQ